MQANAYARISARGMGAGSKFVRQVTIPAHRTHHYATNTTEVQVIECAASSVVFTLSFRLHGLEGSGLGEPTSELPFDVSASQPRAALNELSTINENNGGA